MFSLWSHWSVGFSTTIKTIATNEIPRSTLSRFLVTLEMKMSGTIMLEEFIVGIFVAAAIITCKKYLLIFQINLCTQWVFYWRVQNLGDRKWRKKSNYFRPVSPFTCAITLFFNHKNTRAQFCTFQI